MPAQAGIHRTRLTGSEVDSRLRGNDSDSGMPRRALYARRYSTAFVRNPVVARTGVKPAAANSASRSSFP